MSRVPPTTPLRRTSHASLYALARSGSASSAPPDASAPASLVFLAPALAQLADEADALAGNVAATAAATDALERFNDGFGAFLYVLRMNAFTTYWPQAPTELSHELAERRRELDARRAEEDERARLAAETAAAEAARRPPSPDQTAPDVTASNFTFADLDASTAPPAAKKKAGATGKRAPPSAKEKRKRGALIERVVGLLPLAFRGSDPALRRHMETVLEKMLDNSARGFKLLDLTAPPDLNEARVRKCILALSAAKIVRSDNSTGTVLYRWVGPPDR